MTWTGILLAMGAAVSAAADQPPAVPMPQNGVWNVLDFEARPDGTGDNTGSFQQALDHVHELNGGIIDVPPGRYRFGGSITIPSNVTLRGTYRYAPSHAGLRDKGQEKPITGTVFEPVGGRGGEEGAPFITIQGNAALQGVTVHYPEQQPGADAPAPYPWAIRMRGNNPALRDVQLLNPYLGIDASKNQRALIRNVHGQPIKTGLYVDSVYDIGRIENVHWNPWWTINSPIYQWQMEHGTGFVFAKTDWHYVLNTFCYGYHVGYHFTSTERGAANGNFLGIGADNCNTAVLIDETAPMGLLITNGEFVSFEGPDPTMVRVKATHSGTVRFSNCAFWGPSNRNAHIDGHGAVGFSDCTFMQWAHHDTAVPSIEAVGGSVLIRGCEFLEDKQQVRLGPNVERAIVSENLMNGEIRIGDEAGRRSIVDDNLGMPGKRWRKRNLEAAHGFRLHHLAPESGG